MRRVKALFLFAAGCLVASCGARSELPVAARKGASTASAGGSGGSGGSGGASSSAGGSGGCSPNAGGLTPIVAGASYGAYEVLAIMSEGAPCGAYTFDFLGPTEPTIFSVELLRDGANVTVLTYPWQTTVGGGMSFTFDFTGWFAITVTSAGGGTMDLSGMQQSIFDGHHVLLVP